MGQPASKLTACVIVCSDRAFAGTYKDLSGPAAAAWLKEKAFVTADPIVIPDEVAAIKETVGHGVKSSDLVVISGGTGLGSRDVTPQVLDEICDYEIRGFGELMRRGSAEFTKHAYLSRCGAWVKDRKLVVAMPGNQKAVVEQLTILGDLLSSAICALHDQCQHRGTPAT